MGVVAQLIKGGHQVEGFDCVFGGNIPIGAGLSSSAALENGVGFGLSELFDLKLDRVTLLKYSQKAEHEYAGVACGIMDQFASKHAALHAQIDSEEHRPHPDETLLHQLKKERLRLKDAITGH